MKTAMTAISIHLSGRLARASQKLATHLRMSRAQFIRLAIEHEIERWQIEQEQHAMAKSFVAMQKDKRYLDEAREITEGLDDPLMEDKDRWWEKK
ncbi:MAG TPA: hypothetical protein VI844_00645 [Coxiellaceae bacterium]|nr:hypothetical protein [Coxiellaceae bacterium]